MTAEDPADLIRERAMNDKDRLAGNLHMEFPTVVSRISRQGRKRPGKVRRPRRLQGISTSWPAPRHSAVMGLVALAWLSGCAHQEPYSVTPISRDRNKPKVALLSEHGVSRKSLTAAHHMLAWTGMSVETVDANRINEQGLAGFDMICVPGGNMYMYGNRINEQGRSNIVGFVNGGGAYLGICGGAYYAAEKVVFLGYPPPMKPLGLFPGEACGPVRGVSFIKRKTCTVEELAGSPLDLPAGSGTHSMVYIVSPGLKPWNEAFKWAVLRYSSNPDWAAAVALKHGNGRVFLIGTHPEIEVDDQRDGLEYLEHLDDLGSDWPFMLAAVNWCLDRD